MEFKKGDRVRIKDHTYFTGREGIVIYPDPKYNIVQLDGKGDTNSFDPSQLVIINETEEAKDTRLLAQNMADGYIYEESPGVYRQTQKAIDLLDRLNKTLRDK